ncbi:MAG: hypothetical protein U0835_03515 [Isosphaeraceae bacterium]
MPAISGQLADPSGGSSVAVTGTISDPADMQATGELEFADSETILQAVLEGKTLLLTLDDGSTHDVKVSEVNPGAGPGTSRASFTRA